MSPASETGRYPVLCLLDGETSKGRRRKKGRCFCGDETEKAPSTRFVVAHLGFLNSLHRFLPVTGLGFLAIFYPKQKHQSVYIPETTIFHRKTHPGFSVAQSCRASPPRWLVLLALGTLALGEEKDG